MTQEDEKMSVHKVFVDGQEGTTGLQIDEYLRRRRDVTVLRIDPVLRKDPAERARLLNAADVAFLCLPDAAARESVALVDNSATCVIDTSTAHRVDSAWTYGLPELDPEQRQRIRDSKRIANPGCHATAFILAVRPLVDAGLLPAEHLLSATSHTGYSGGGKKMIAQYRAALAALRMSDDGRGASVTEGGATAEAEVSVEEARKLLAPRPYALGLTHKHLPEMMRYARLAHAPVFLPVVAPYYKGLAVSVPLDLAQIRAAGKMDVNRAAIHATLAARYAGERFVQVAPLDAAPEGGLFDVQGSNDTNRADLFVFGNDDQCMLVARIDNLGKGASGAAVQAMNIHLGLDEATGLA